MKKLLSIIGVGIFLFVAASCQEDVFTPVKVTYKVKVKSGNTVTITCNNDYYFDTGVRKPITWTSDGTTWRSDHFVYEEEDYFINVVYTDSTQAVEDNYKVQVFYNDTIPAAASITDHAVPVVEFSGRVKEL